MVEAAEIVILERVVLSVKPLSLLTERDYVLVDEVSLNARILVAEECCTILEDHLLIGK